MGQGGGVWDIKGLRGRVKGVLGGWKEKKISKWHEKMCNRFSLG